ncbi:hypothetical protein H0X10_03935 [Candidatus Saccharibacteria bacterium]|nr:hypothetical protein [Candidatus Saccharibacteria bacterium]
MGNAETILVIILASFLAILLLVAIIATVKIIQVLNHLKHISEKAEAIADKAESVGDFFSRAAGPMAIGNMLVNISEIVFKKKFKKKR